MARDMLLLWCAKSKIDLWPKAKENVPNTPWDYKDYFQEQTIWRFKGNNWELADTGIKTDMMKFNNLFPHYAS